MYLSRHAAEIGESDRAAAPRLPCGPCAPAVPLRPPEGRWSATGALRGLWAVLRTDWSAVNAAGPPLFRAGAAVTSFRFYAAGLALVRTP